SEETEMMEMLENVVEMSENASQMVVTEVQVTGSENKGTPGRAVGTGRGPLGAGGGPGGYPREQRWFVRFSDKTSLKPYAKQLDFFKIELAAFFPSERKLVYLTNMSADKPTSRIKTQGKDKRLNMNWQGNSARAKADRALFAKAGIDASGAAIIHFYPQNVEQMLIQQERKFQNQPSNRIRRTYFAVMEDGNGFKFSVTRQVLK
ncbi:MAG: hypothetical protein AB8G99_12035, partial [Planctomycetaceae bacterium]